MTQTTETKPGGGLVAARQHMVDSQLRPNKVTDPALLAVMRTLPREDFLPVDRRHLAYGDDDVALLAGRVLAAPMTTAKLLQLAAPRAGERALVIGAGPGYSSAILSALGLDVTAVEQDPTLLGLARAGLAATGHAVRLVQGPLAEGWAAAGPYDLVLIEGAAPAVPPAVAAQVGGRLVGVIMPPHGSGRAVLAEPVPGGLSMQPAFDCATALLPSLLPAPSFVF